MKLVFREYLASLRERNELDVVLPDLLSELGFNVISRPSTGPRQFGVDVAAVGPEIDGERKLYLFTIKQGDLTRAEWDAVPQGVRTSINDIIDVYIPKRISTQYESLRIVICLCFGGDVKEAVRDNLTGLMSRLANDRISFEEWNGDYMAGLLANGVLQHQHVSKTLQSHFQKSIAMLDEPDVSIRHFTALIEGLVKAENLEASQRLATLRQMYICLSVLFVWARTQENLEAPYRASELVILRAWELVKRDIEDASIGHKHIGLTFNELLDLHTNIWSELIEVKILPLTAKRDALASSVNSHSAVDINLKLFEVLGRIAVRGLWVLWPHLDTNALQVLDTSDVPEEASDLARHIVELINNNQALFSPIADEQVTNISCALTFLSMMKDWRSHAKEYCRELLNYYHFNFIRHYRYPTIYGSYQELIRHPQARTEECRAQHTKGSTLIPIMLLFSTLGGKTEASEHFARFARSEMKHCNHQLWMPGPDTEVALYHGDSSHGFALCDIPITADGAAARDILIRECSDGGHYTALSSVRLGHWPVFVMACRHSRLPLPPQLWFPLIKREEPVSSVVSDTWQPTLETLQAHSVYWSSRRTSANLSPSEHKKIHLV
ncbi:chemotaxis protein [Pseudomonas oryzihabitans]|uniref:chemotaxis protein n=1 Tax=Pseudomonas oryzihabitans TaxID=47885 RepID=UPI00112089F9|nr:chemotaxis protein [Pseudomonas psychrotolerans]QDD88261.1 chemotaxis protein [Pseudomonas psychrotolerans]